MAPRLSYLRNSAYPLSCDSKTGLWFLQDDMCHSKMYSNILYIASFLSSSFEVNLSFYYVVKLTGRA